MRSSAGSLANAIDDALRRRGWSRAARDGADRKPDHARTEVAIRILLRLREIGWIFRWTTSAPGIRASYLTKLADSALKIDNHSSKTSKERPGDEGLGAQTIISLAPQPEAQVVGEGWSRSAIRIPEEARLRRGQGFHWQADAGVGVRSFSRPGPTPST